LGGRRYETISFLSDYGRADEFVGVVHSVIRSIAPHVTVVDLVHDLPPFDVRAASLALSRSVQYVAPGIVLAIVDPGVGTERRAIAVSVGVDGEGVLIGPDNGLLAPAVAMSGGTVSVVALENPLYQLPAPGPTFAGRDVFAPAAAHLAAGVPLSELGPPVDPYSLMPGLIPLSRPADDGGVIGEVLWVDTYGNCQLNIDPSDVSSFGPSLILRIGSSTSSSESRRAQRVTSFASLGTGDVGVVVDSYGLLAVVMDRTSAAAALSLYAGAAVTVSPGT
jgi:S-adenosylmethionine hydrolase